MDLEDSGNENANTGGGETGSSADGPGGHNPGDWIETPDGSGAPSAGEYVEEVADLAAADPTSAGDRVGDLLQIVREHDGDVRDAAGEVLNVIGLLRPDEFDVWADDLVAVAESETDDIAFLGLRALAQLAATNERAAAKGLPAAFDRVESGDTALRQAALSVVAEVGAADPESVRRADRPVAAALRDADATVRLAGAIAAGRLLGAAPAQFPRTAPALLDALDDEAAEVRTYAHISLAHFAQQHPENVPDAERSIEALVSVTDADLGLREGATDEAVAGLLELTLDVDPGEV